MTNRMWNTLLRTEEDEKIEKSKMSDGRYQVRMREKRSGSKNENGNNHLGKIEWKLGVFWSAADRSELAEAHRPVALSEGEMCHLPGHRSHLQGGFSQGFGSIWSNINSHNQDVANSNLGRRKVLPAVRKHSQGCPAQR